MNKNSEIIRIEIIRVLNESGKIRGNDLAKRVIKKVGNEKTVYREISSLVEAGEIEKEIHGRNYIEYKLVNLSESVNSQLKNIFKEIKIIYDEIVNFYNISKEEKFSFHERLRSVMHFIHLVQSTDGIMKLLSVYPTFKKDKMFSHINRKINDCWQVIMDAIVHQTEEEFLNEVISNLRISRRDSQNIN